MIQEVPDMRPLSTILFLLILALPAIAGHPFDQPFNLNVRESLQLGDNDLIIGFEGILSDSRCPQDVYCFWEGDAEASLWIQVTGEERQNFVLHTASMFPGLIELNAFTVRLLQVTPYPIIDVPIDPDTYIVTLVVSLAAVDAEEISWGLLKALYR
jgi:hypothetical protein